MRAFISLLLVLPFVAFSQGKTSQELMANGMKKYAAQSGRITYQISGDATGTEVFSFDRFGWRSLKKRHMEFELDGEEMFQEQHEVTDGKLVYRIEHSDSTYRKRMDIRWSTLAQQLDPAATSEAVIQGIGGIYVGDSTYQDKICKVWTFEGKSLKEMWTWEGLVLKRRSTLAEKVIITSADKIEIGIPIEEWFFRLPESYELKK